MKNEETQTTNSVKLAAAMLADNENFKTIMQYLRTRREGWVRDYRAPAVYQNHAELVATTTRVAELDDLLDLLE